MLKLAHCEIISAGCNEARLFFCSRRYGRCVLSLCNEIVFIRKQVVLCLLDFVRIAIGHGDFTYIADRPCKFDASLTCAPFTGTPC